MSDIPKKAGIYKFTSPTRRIYIGKATNLYKRFLIYIRLKFTQQKSFFNSVNKYGLENHIFEILEYCEKDRLVEREIYWIAFYKSNANKYPQYNGLNLTDGGDGGATYGRLNTKWSEQQRINNRKSRLGKPVNHTKEGDLARKLGRKKYYNDNKKSVFQYDLNGKFIRQFDSAIDAGIYLKIKAFSNITRACKNNRSSYGYQWKYYYEEQIGMYSREYYNDSKISIKEILILKNNGYSNMAISKLLNVSCRTIYRRLEKHIIKNNSK